jgi:hypothetical protein
MMDRRPAVARQRRRDVDQGMIDLGQAKAKITDLTRLVTRRLAIVDSAKKPGEHQRSGKTGRAEPRAQGRFAHFVDLAPLHSGRAYGIPHPPTTAPSTRAAGLNPISPGRDSPGTGQQAVATN